MSRFSFPFSFLVIVFQQHQKAISWLVLFYPICNSQCTKQKNYFRIGPLGKIIPETPVTPVPDPSTPNIFTIQKTYITLLNIDLNELVPLDSPSDTIVLGC